MTITMTFESIDEMREALMELMGADPREQKVDIPNPGIVPPEEALQKTAQTMKSAAFSQQTSAVPASVQLTPATPTPATVPAQQTPVTPAAVPTTEPAYKLDDLSRAGMQLVQLGRQPQLLDLLKQFSVESLPALPAEQYGAFATALRALGASI